MFYFLPALQADQRCQVYKVFFIAVREQWGSFVGGDGMSKHAELCFLWLRSWDRHPTGYPIR